MNKKSILTIITAALIIASALTACNDTKKIPDRTDAQSTIASEPEKAHYTFVEQSQKKPTNVMSEDKETLYITSTVEKVSFVAENRADREASRKINNALDTIYSHSKTLYQGLQADISAASKEDASTFPWDIKVDYTCTRNDGRALSVTETIDYYAAGNQTGTNRFSYNFDPITGDQIRNVFYTTGDTDGFNSADNTIYEKLLAKYGEEVIDYDNVSASFIDEAFDCWRFTEDGVVVTFNVGSIANVEAGILEVEYSKEELPEFAQKYFN